ncbi:hypothetical protein ABK046_43515 [Streptomyces caeruleatus]
MARPSRHPLELRRRAVRMDAGVLPDYDTEWAAMKAVARKRGIGATGTLRKWVRQDQIDAGSRPGNDERGVGRAQAAEETERRAEAGRHPQSRGVFRRGQARPATHTLVAFIKEHKDRFGSVEPICRILTDHDCKIAPSTYDAHHKRQAAPAARTLRDA